MGQMSCMLNGIQRLRHSQLVAAGKYPKRLPEEERNQLFVCTTLASSKHPSGTVLEPLLQQGSYM